MIRAHDVQGEPARAEDDASFQAFLAKPELIHYAAMHQRPGVMECCATLENTHYAPDTPRNDYFHIRVFTWGGLRWLLISIPLEEKTFMERAAAANGLRVANGTPHMISGEGIERFPANNERVFTLENVSGHPVYGKRRA